MTDTASVTAKQSKQLHRQKDSTRWDSYEEAKVWFDQLPKKTRKRIRRRAGGHFDVVVFEPVPTAAPVDAQEQPA